MTIRDPLRSIDLNLLPVFEVLMRTRSVTRAAEELGMTQASASNALDRLRKSLGDRILEREGNGMVPTRLALSLIPEVSDALAQLAASLAGRSQFDPAETAISFRIGMDDYAVSLLGADLAARVAALAPAASLEILPATHPHDEERLRQGKIDLFCGAVWAPAPGLLHHALWQEDFVGLRSPLAGLGASPDIKEVLGRAHVLISTRGVVLGNLDAALASRGSARRVGVTVPSYEAAARLVSVSQHLFFCGRRLAQRYVEQLGLIAFEPPLSIPGYEMRMLWTRRNDANPALTWLRGMIEDIAGG